MQECAAVVLLRQVVLPRLQPEALVLAAEPLGVGASALELPGLADGEAHRRAARAPRVHAVTRNTDARDGHSPVGAGSQGHCIRTARVAELLPLTTDVDH